MERTLVISFSEEDMAYVTDLQMRLNQQLRRYRLVDHVGDVSTKPPHAWFYPDQAGGVQYHREIRQRIANSPAVLIVLSKYSGESAWVIDEVAWARDDKKELIVVAQGDIVALKQTTVGRLLGNRVWIDPNHLPPRHDDEISAVIEALVSKDIIRWAMIGDDSITIGRQITNRPYGGMYEGIRERDNTHVIVKEVASGDRDVLRELDERVAQRQQLNHLSLPRIENYIQESERRFVVMEEIPGKSLGELLAKRDKPYSWEEVRPWAEQSLNTLVSMHSQDILHLGIKPQNIKLARGRLKLLDLGLDRRPQSASAIGTPDPYLAPEQLNEREADTRTDTYALGATLYTLLTGDTQPNATKPLAHKRQRDLPIHVSMALHRAMDPDPDKRFSSANAMLSALEQQIGPDISPIGRYVAYAAGALVLIGALVGANYVLRIMFPPSVPAPSAATAVGEIATRIPEAPTAAGAADASPQTIIGGSATQIPEPGVSPTALATPTVGPPPLPIYGPTAQDAINRMMQDGKIIVGVRYDAAPFGSDTNLRNIIRADPSQEALQCNPTTPNPDFKPSGYDIEIVKEFAKRWLGDANKVELRCIPGSNRVPAVRYGDVRIGAFALSKLQARCNVSMGVECSTRYMLDGQGILVRKGSGIEKLCDVGGKKVAVVGKTSAETLFVDGAKLFCGFETLPLLEVVASREVAISLLLSGAVDAYATNVEILKASANEHPNDLIVVPGEFGEEEFGVAVTPNEAGLLDLVNTTIQAMKKDGRLDDLLHTGFQSAIPPFDIPFDTSKVFPPFALDPTRPRQAQPTAQPAVTSGTYNVQVGETLSGIARKVYSNSGLWRCIADKNNIKDPKALRPGPLTIPDKATCTS